MTKRCLIMAGGTGGHVFPGLAVAHALTAKGWEVHWLGTAERMEADVVPKHGFPIHFVPVKGLRGKGLLSKVTGVLELFKGLVSARRIVKTLKPQFVLGMGGYASGPGGIAAWSLGIPVIVHEQNAAAGLTNRILGRFAKRILLGFDAAGLQFSRMLAKCQTVGNPVRDEIRAIEEKTSVSSPLKMLVVGGSLGARPLNQIVPEVMQSHPDVEVWHQSGKGNADAVREAYGQRDVKVTEFIDDMAAAYTWADFVVCRAGALTVAEVAAAGRAAIFVPLPFAVDDHQTKNAESLSMMGAAVLIPQAALDATLGSRIAAWVKEPEKCLKMGKKAREQASLQATELVVTQCEALQKEVA